MNYSSQSSTYSGDPVQSPHPDLQAVLPRLATVGPHFQQRPLFDDLGEAQEHLEDMGAQATYKVVPVWAINHNDLTSSQVVNWTFVRYVN